MAEAEVIDEGAGDGGEGAGGTPPITPARGTTTGQPVGTPATPPAPVRTVPRPAIANITQEGLNTRLQAERERANKQWAETLGYKTPAEAQAALARAKELEEKETAKKLSEMTELERARAIIAEKDARLAEVEAQADALETSVLVEKQDRIIESQAAGFVKPKFISFATIAFKAHLKTLSKEDVENMPIKEVKQFFKDFAKENPELAPEAPGAVAVVVPAKPQPVRRAITTGAPPPRRPPAPAASAAAASLGGKTPRPGQPNSMTPAEVRAFAKAQHGIDYPGGASGSSPRAARR